jgi:hypothetical protein
MKNRKAASCFTLLSVAILSALLGCSSSTDGGRHDGSVALAGSTGSTGDTVPIETGGISGGSAARGGTGGTTGLGGTAVATTGAGGRTGAGGTTALGGTTTLGGTTAMGGATTGTSSAGGRTGRGGTSASGGSVVSGGATSAVSGNTGTGGRAGGTTSSGGSATTGGTTSGGRAGGTTSTGGTTATGGTTGVCTPTWQDPPSNVSAWIDESWNSQLGNNVRSRKAWLLDSVLLGKGQVNLCVRWGATTAPSAAVKAGMAAAVEKWFNDWFSNLTGYACFPHAQITTKVTGWAVRSGNTAWVSDLDSSIKIYTETDAEGEPKCPDNCSFFTNWSHSFPNCAGGEAFHHDYWLWLDDTISGNAAAVGGDWGLRMPMKNFIAAMNQSDSVIEHEMGHGFGFQDYYDWTGSKPTGGSLMIVGSAQSKIPTIADQWLLRRTWKEMKTLRGW